MDPLSARAHAGYGATLVRLGRLEEGIAAYRDAIRINPEYTRAHQNLGGVYLTIGDVERALASYRRAAQNADFVSHSDLLHALNFHPGASPAEILRAYEEFGRSFPAAPPRPLRKSRTRLRIGYVSGDFWNHVICLFFEPLLAAHDRDAFEIFCYANSAKRDDTTGRLKALAHHWCDIRGRPDDEVETLIRRDGIDILVDLSGHGADHRLSLFARKPAPVQATYLGYPNTTGVRAIDYRITDAVADPPGLTDAFHTEELVRLQRCFVCYGPPPDAPAVTPLPPGCTFGSFSNPAKWNDEVLITWARILARVPGSRLLLHHGAAAHKTPEVHSALRKRVLSVFAGQGIDPGRIQLYGHLDSPGHFALYEQTALSLDPFPYTGTTGTCESLWMGVPVIALEGATHIARVSTSLLHTAGLAHFVAQSREEYVELAVRRVGAREELAALRSDLRGRLQSSPLLDGAGLARAIEDAYRAMWRRYVTRYTTAKHKQ